MGKIRVAIIGVGNCASSLVQGVEFYRHAPEDEFVPGLMHVRLGGYHIGDIEFSAAFDIDRTKVGKDLSEAIFAAPNNTYKFSDVPHLGVPVSRGMTHDGLGKYLKEIITKASGSTADVVGILKETRTDVVVSYLPVGSEMATKWYVEQILDAGCGFINCIPVFIAREEYWQKRFQERGLPMEAWLFRIAHNLVVDHLRRGSRFERADEDEAALPDFPDPAHIAEERLMMADVRAAMMRLTQDQRDVVSLRFFGGLSSKETADVLHTSDGAVREMQRAALEKMRGLLIP